MTQDEPDSVVRVAVLVATYRRPEHMSELLPLLVAEVEALPGARLVVVDNDTTPTARALVEPWTVGHPVVYVHEPRPGIAAARNRGLDEAMGDDLVVFIDDDERPLPGWLAHLVSTHRRFGQAGVVGPVLAEVPEPVDPWVVAGGWFRRASHPTGTLVPVAATNNLLLDARALRAWGVRFDDAFGLSGGSDTVLSLEIGRRGGQFVWCDEAEVRDLIPAARARREWVRKRSFRSGNTAVRAAVRVEPSPVRRFGIRVRYAVGGVLRVMMGGAYAFLGIVARRLTWEVRGTQAVMRGRGMALGAVGHVYGEYVRSGAPVVKGR